MRAKLRECKKRQRAGAPIQHALTGSDAACLLEVCAYQIDQVFSQLRRNLLLDAVHKMEADVGFQHFTHQAVHPTPHSCEQHELVAAVCGLRPKCNGRTTKTAVAPGSAA